MPYVVKAAVPDPDARSFTFRAQKTMYRGKEIRAKDEIYIFDSENEGGAGLIARGVVTRVAGTPVKREHAQKRVTPRVSIQVKRTAAASRHLGRQELKPFRNWGDGRPETELCFKLYRQATNKIIGISDATAAFLGKFF